jgi:hypothetical protein
MQAPSQGGGSPNPHDLSLHKQVKDIADLLRPELLRLHKCGEEKSGNIQLYVSFTEQIQLVKKEVTNHDALFAFQNVINHMQKAIELAQKSCCNQEILWHLQEVMALLFKVQNLPS